MPPAQVVDITTVKNFVSFTLGATDTWAGAIDDPKYGGSTNVDTFITTAILNVDGAVVRAIMSNPKHPKRGAYLSPVSVTNGSIIGEHIGPIGKVKIDSNLGIEADPEDIRRWAQSPTIYGSPTGYFGVAGETLYFNGTSATVDVCTYSRTSACQAPSEYTMLVAHLTLATIFKLGARPEMSNHHLSLALIELQSVGEDSNFLAAVLKEIDK